MNPELKRRVSEALGDPDVMIPVARPRCHVTIYGYGDAPCLNSYREIAAALADDADVIELQQLVDGETRLRTLRAELVLGVMQA